MLGDQILYWNIALRPWRDLPLGGGPSSVGGTTLGPAFLWTMWGIRHVIGPWTDYLPHAGGIGLSIIQSAADALLVVAIWKRFGSLALALAVTLFIATSPEEMSLSASIWNPVLAVAFIKMAIAFVLLDVRDRSLRWSAAATAAAVLAVQCHSSAVFLAGPLIASFPVLELLARRRDRAVTYAGAIAAVILVLEAPFLLDLATGAGKRTSPAAVVDSVAFTIGHPGSIRPVAAFHALVDACQAILLRPWTAAWFGMLLVACAAVTAFRMRRQVTLACVSVVPLLAAIAGFAFWQRPFEYYWFLTVMPSVALTIGMALTAWRPAAWLAAAALAILVVAAQPARYAESRTIYRMPEYGALRRGSQEIRRRVTEIRRIDIEFTVPPSTNTYFIYETVLGGRVTPAAPFTATIERTGRVRFTP